MVATLWLCSGEVIVNGDGEPVYCEDDPCPDTDCTNCSTQAASINASFASVAELSPADCTSCDNTSGAMSHYNNTSYPLSKVSGANCEYLGAGECGQIIQVLMNGSDITGNIYDDINFTTLLATFTKSISAPYDCSATHNLSYDSQDGSPQCEWSGATMTLN